MHTLTVRLPAAATALLAALTALPTSDSGPRAQQTGATRTCSGLLVVDQGSVRAVGLDGVTAFRRAASSAYPSGLVCPTGPRILMADSSGVAVLERTGVVLGTVPLGGAFPQLTFGGDRVVVIDDAAVRILDLDGRAVGQPIPKTGTVRQTVVVDGDRLVVIDSDQVRLFDRTGIQIGAGIPNATGSRVRQRVTVTPGGGRRIVVTDDNGTTIHDRTGNRVGSTIPKQGTARQTVITAPGRIILIDDLGVEIHDENGVRKGGRIPKANGSRRQEVEVCGDRIVILDDERVQVVDLENARIGSAIDKTPGSGRQTVTFTNDRIVITDDAGTRVFDKASMNLVTTIAKVGLDRQQVTTDGDTIVVVEQNQTRIFGRDGLQRGAAIPRTGTETQSIRIEGDRILIIDSDRTRVFERAGDQVSDIPTSNVQEFNVLLHETAISITEDGGNVLVHDRDGMLLRRLPTSPNVAHVLEVRGATDRLVVADGNQVMLLDPHAGAAQVGPTVTTTGDPEIQPICFAPGGFEWLGTSCGASSLTVTGEPRIGADVTLLLQGAPANRPATLDIGFSIEAWGSTPLPFDLGLVGAPGCLITNDVVASTAIVTGPTGITEIPIGLPADPDLVGITGYAQLVVPQAGANQAGLTTTNTVGISIGEGL